MTDNKSLMVFTHPEFGTIRTEVDEENESWFCARDVCVALGYKKPRNAVLRHVDGEDALKRGALDERGCMQETTFVNESGLYALVLGSKLPQAREFKHWITSEVLPSIRKDGGYMVAGEDEDEQALLSRALLLAERTMERLRDKAEYAEQVLMSTDCLTTTQVAKELSMTAVELNQRLCEMKIQYRQSGQYLLYAEYARRGYARARTHGRRMPDGRVRTESYLVWTERGRRFIHYVMRDLFAGASYCV